MSSFFLIWKALLLKIYVLLNSSRMLNRNLNYVLLIADVEKRDAALLQAMDQWVLRESCCCVHTNCKNAFKLGLIMCWDRSSVLYCSLITVSKWWIGKSNWLQLVHSSGVYDMSYCELGLDWVVGKFGFEFGLQTSPLLGFALCWEIGVVNHLFVLSWCNFLFYWWVAFLVCQIIFFYLKYNHLWIKILCKIQND